MALQYKQTLYLGLVLTWVFQISGFLIGNLNNYTCDVERNSCNYTIKSSTDGLLQWTRHTVTRVTKPTTDHTLNGLGHVFNVLTTSRTRILDKTTLHSPVMTGLLGYTAIGFWYSISASGTSAMNFTVLAKTSVAITPVTIFTRLVHGIVHWTQVCYVLPVYGGLDLTFEATALHSGVIGDLAIDDITIKPGNFCTSSHVTSPPPTTGNTVTCDFETSSICGYKNIATSSRDDFNWSRRKGGTASVGTGPTGDHTSHNGYYMYIETSSPRQPGENAMLESPSFPTNEPQYVSFWYNAYGSTLGSLKVYVGYGTHMYIGTPLHTVSLASSTPTWHSACIEVPQRHITSHVIFEGVVGSSYKGDIAIDDVTLGKGSCLHPITTTTMPTVNGHWGSWSSYSACSVSCGTGHVTSTRSCSHPAPSNGGLQCSGSTTRQSICHQPTCPIDGHWSSWGSYGACSVTCGLGYQRSNRLCTNPAPRYGGHPCSGSSTRTLTCRTAACQVDGGWSDWTTWSKCSTSCALGAMSRDRSCSYPVPSGGGKQCAGDHVESHECTLGPCPTWSHWYQGDCSSTCGNGTAERMRSCSTGNNADCAGISYTHVPCVGIEYILLVFICLNSVDGFLVTNVSLRNYTCNFEHNCHQTVTSSSTTGIHWTKTPAVVNYIDHTWQQASRGHFMAVHSTAKSVHGDTSTLKTPLIPGVHGNTAVGFWYKFSGTKTDGMRLNVYILGGNGSDTTPVFAKREHDHTQWRHACIITVARNPIRVSFEAVVTHAGVPGKAVIDDVTVQHGRNCTIHMGHPLTTSKPEVTTLAPQTTTLHGTWSTWGAWSQCSTSCDKGTRTRTRTCVGHSCIGHKSESTDCSLVECSGNWADWEAWSRCSASCGPGTKSRTRTCVGNTCVGVSSDSTVCMENMCPVDGEWGPWLTYSECTVTCGTGRMYSSRACTNPAPKYNGRDCVGNLTRETGCILASCSVDGGWAIWTTWSDCTTSCGLGTLSRVRVCSYPRPLGDGKPCPGESTETHECSKGICPTWTSWFSHPCSVTCGSGTMERMRTCSTKNNGDCTGEYYEIVQCKTVPCTSMVTVQEG